MRSSNLHRNMKKRMQQTVSVNTPQLPTKAMLEAKTDKKASHGKKDISSILANQ